MIHSLIIAVQAVLPLPAVDSPAPILSVIPEDAAAAVMIRDWPDIQRRVASLESNVLSPWMPTIELLKRRMWIADGLRDSGEAALVLFPLDGANEPADVLVIILPVDDRTRILALWQPREPVGGIREITWQDKPAFAGFRDGYVVISPERNNVARVLQAPRRLSQTLGDNLLARMGASDLGIWLQLERLGTRGRDALFSTWLPDTGNLAKAVTDQAGAVMLGARATRQGVQLDGYVEIKTFNEAFWPTVRHDLLNPPSPMTGRPCLSLGWAGGEGLVAMFSSVLGRDSGMVVPAAQNDFEQHVMRLAASLRSGLFHVAARNDAAQNDAESDAYVIGLVLHAAGGAADLLDKWRNLIEFIKRGPFAEPLYNALGTSVQYRRHQETINALPVDHVVADVDTGSSLEAAALERSIAGNGLVIRCGLVGENLLLLLGGDEEDFAKLSTDVARGQSGRAAIALARRSAEASIHWNTFARFFEVMLTGGQRGGNPAAAGDAASRAAFDEAKHADAAPIHIEVRPRFNGMGISIQIPAEALRIPSRANSVQGEF